MDWGVVLKSLGLEIFAVTIAIWIADAIQDWYKKRNSPPDLGCDWCEEIRNLYHSPDKRWWYCRKCMESYMKDGGFTEGEKESVRRKYKARPSKKIMPKRKKNKKTRQSVHADS